MILQFRENRISRGQIRQEYGQAVAGVGLLVYAGVVLVSAVGRAISGLVTGLGYNIVSSMSGGVKVELEQKS